MKNQSLIFILSLSFFFACTNKKENPTSDISPEIKEEIIDTNIFVVKEKCAVFLHPDEQEIEEIKAKYGEDGLGEIASDIAFYSAEAADILKKKDIKILKTDKRKILFIQENGTRDTLNRIDLEGDMIYFMADKSPKVTYTVDATADLSYFTGNESVDFFEGYWASDRIETRVEADYIFKSFYKTSFVNDYPLLQYFDDGEIKEEEVLIQQKEIGRYKHPKEDVYFEFRKDALTRTEGGAINGYNLVIEKRIKE